MWPCFWYLLFCLLTFPQFLLLLGSQLWLSTWGPFQRELQKGFLEKHGIFPQPRGGSANPKFLSFFPKLNWPWNCPEMWWKVQKKNKFSWWKMQFFFIYRWYVNICISRLSLLANKKSRVHFPAFCFDEVNSSGHIPRSKAGLLWFCIGLVGLCTFFGLPENFYLDDT